jgi:hypothetical protein
MLFKGETIGQSGVKSRAAEVRRHSPWPQG